jgi:hypothetical protein
LRCTSQPSQISPSSEKAEHADQAAPSEKQSEGFWGKVATDPLIAFTGLLALVTTILALATAVLASASFRGIALTRGEFLASHRPLLDIYAIRILEFDQSRRPDDQPLRAEFAVINAGTGVGSVTGSAVYLEYLPQTDRPHPLRLARNDVIRPGRFEVGASNNHIPVCSNRWSGNDHVRAATDNRRPCISAAGLCIKMSAIIRVQPISAGSSAVSPVAISMAGSSQLMIPNARKPTRRAALAFIPPKAFLVVERPGRSERIMPNA